MADEIVYACTTTGCTERFRGFTDEPSFCSICWEDLTEVANPNARPLDELNAFAERVWRVVDRVGENADG